MKKSLFLICTLALMLSVLSCHPVNEADKPLKPIELKHGEVTATFRVNGKGSVRGGALRNPITGVLQRVPKNTDSIFFYSNSAYMASKLSFRSSDFVLGAPCINGYFPIILIPEETLTLEVDMATVELRKQKKATIQDCYKLSGTIGDINQVLLDNMEFEYQMFYNDVIPAYTQGQTFPEWSESLWQSFDTLRTKKLEQHPEYTRRQRDFLTLFLNNVYVNVRLDYLNKLKEKMKLSNPDSALALLKETYTLKDARFKDLKLYRDGTTFYLPLNARCVPYLEANGLNSGEVYDMIKGFADAQQLGKKLGNLEVQSDDVITTAHPHFQPILRMFNDSIKRTVERLQQVAEERIMPTPDVTGDKLLQTIVSQYPGKAVFIDCWATWCAPCIKGIEAMEPLKEKLKESDVVFVYLTDESSPESNWKTYIAKIPGVHYRIPTSLWNQIPNNKGIPQYYLYDRQGKRVWETTGFGDESLKMIEEAIIKVK